MNAKWAVVLAGIVAFGFAISGVHAQSGDTAHAATPVQAPASTSGPKKAEEQFKNIQVLKGIPAEQVIPTMQFIAASLGVGCEYCHVHNAFDKDEKKPKQTARKMMDMMFAINKDDFEGHRAVTCNSCHRGYAIPQAVPAVMSEEPKDAMMAPPVPKPPDAKENAGPTAEQLLDKYVQALGGAAAIEKISSRVMKGTMDFGGKSVPIDIYSKRPKERISYAHMPDGDSITAFNGHEGWMASAGRPGIHEMQGSELEAAAIDADLQLATHLKPMFSELRVQEPEKIGERETYVVLGAREGKPPIRLYFDEQSGLLVRLVRFGETALGWLPTQIDYADYRDTDGAKIPYRWTLARPSGRFTIQVTEMKQNVPVDDAKFVKPPPVDESKQPKEPKAPAK